MILLTSLIIKGLKEKQFKKKNVQYQYLKIILQKAENQLQKKKFKKF